MVRKMLIAFICTTAGLGALPADAAESQPIAWSDLVPDYSFPDPFRKLSRKQLQDLSHVVRIRHLVAAEKMIADSTDVREAAEIEQRLQKSGVDVQWLMAQRRHIRRLREEQAKAIEQDMVGKVVRLSGFVVPLKKSDDLVTEFLLVPSLAVCSHSSPPPPNQMVFVQSHNGVVVRNRLTTVSVTGQVETRETTRRFLRANGPVQFTAAYAISAEEVVVHSDNKRRVSPPKDDEKNQRPIMKDGNIYKNMLK